MLRFLGRDNVQSGYTSTSVTQKPSFFYPEVRCTIYHNTLVFMQHST